MIKKKIIPKVQVKAKVVPKTTSPTVVSKPIIARPLIVKPVAIKPIIKPVVKSAIKSVNKPVSKLITTKAPLKKIITPVQKEAAVKVEIKKKKLAEVTPEHETYFVYLKQPLEYRRHLLEASRKILFCLKSHQKIFLIRQKKIEEMNKLKTSVRELLYLNKKFNEKLPKYNTGFLEDMPSKDKSRPVNVKSSGAKKPADLKPERTEMDRLEESLANIEKKLKTLQ
jgi:hypothetical protein